MSARKNTSTPTAPAAAAPEQAKVTAPAPAPANCRCGCGAPTVRPSASYLPGHDARHAGAVGRSLLAGADEATALAALPTEALKEKARGLVRTAQARQAKQSAGKQARAAAQAAAKAAYAKALADALA